MDGRLPRLALQSGRVETDRLCSSTPPERPAASGFPPRSGERPGWARCCRAARRDGNGGFRQKMPFTPAPWNGLSWSRATARQNHAVTSHPSPRRPNRKRPGKPSASASRTRANAAASGVASPIRAQVRPIAKAQWPWTVAISERERAATASSAGRRSAGDFVDDESGQPAADDLVLLGQAIPAGRR
jgi:hypothetical protein